MVLVIPNLKLVWVIWKEEALGVAELNDVLVLVSINWGKALVELVILESVKEQVLVGHEVDTILVNKSEDGMDFCLGFRGLELDSNRKAWPGIVFIEIVHEEAGLAGFDVYIHDFSPWISEEVDVLPVRLNEICLLKRLVGSAIIDTFFPGIHAYIFLYVDYCEGVGVNHEVLCSP